MHRNLTLIALVFAGLTGPAVSQETATGRWFAENFYSAVLTGDTGALASTFADGPDIDTPRTGSITGVEEFGVFLAEERAWLESLGASGDKCRASSHDKQ